MISSSYEGKRISEKLGNHEHLPKQIRNLVDIQLQTVKEIELIKRSQRYMVDY
jgi:hypothetical protein